MVEVFANGASSSLGSDITSTDLSLTVASGSAFSTPAAGQQGRLVLDNEIIIFTARSGNVLSWPSTAYRGAEGTAAASHTAGATVTQELTAGALAALAASSGLVLLEQHTAAASAQLDFTSWYFSAYDEYVIELLNVIPVTDNVQFAMRVSTNGGSSYDSTSLYAESDWGWSNSGSGANGVPVGSPAAQWSVSSPADNLSNNASYGLCGSLRLFGPGGSLYKQVSGQVSLLNASGDLIGLSKAMVYKSATAVNALRFYMSSGNVSSGTIRIFGIQKA